MEKPYVVPNGGGTFKLGDFVDGDIERLADRYNRTSAARVGLAYKGFVNQEDLAAEMTKIRQKHEGNTSEFESINEFLNNVQNDILGLPAGDTPHAALQAGKVAGQMLHLARQGVYNIVDFARIAQELSYTAVMSRFLPSFRGVLNAGHYDKVTAKTITDIIAGGLFKEGEYRSVVKHVESNHNTPLGYFSQWTAQAGQSLKFLTGSEYLRRFQVSMVTGIMGDLVDGLIVPARQAKSKDFLRSLNVPDPMIDRIIHNLNTHGRYTDNWEAGVSEYMGAVLGGATDNLAIMVRQGEVPSFLAYSEVGRTLMPYFTFTAASNQKLLRNSYNRGGPMSVAMMFVHQAPLAIIATAMANIMAGKEADEDILKKAVSIAPGLGYLSVGTQLMMRGEMGGAPTPMAIINAAYKLPGAVAEGDLQGVATSTPALAVFFPARMVIGAMQDK
jgi:hypothetical protein